MLRYLSRVGEAMIVAVATFLAAPPAVSQTVTGISQDDYTGGEYTIAGDGIDTFGPYGTCFSVIAQASPTRQYPEVAVGPGWYMDDPTRYENRCTPEMVGLEYDPVTGELTDTDGCSDTDAALRNLIPFRTPGFDSAVCVTEIDSIIGVDKTSLDYFDFRFFRNDPSVLPDGEGNAFAWSYLPWDADGNLTLNGGEVVPFQDPDYPFMYDLTNDSGPAQYNACQSAFLPSTFDNDWHVDPDTGQVYDPLTGAVELPGGNARIVYYLVTAGLACRHHNWAFFIDGSLKASGTIGDFAGGKYLILDVEGIPAGAEAELQVRDQPGAPGCSVAGSTKANNAVISGIFVDGTYACNPPVCTIEKSTNGHDADAAPGPEIEEGQPVTWTYEVTNENDFEMFNISLLDDQLGAITCPSTTLAGGASMTCTANGTAVLGQYANLGTVTGETVWGDVACDDPSHYFGTPIITPEPVCTIEKSTNGHDADAAPGPEIPVGGAVLWTYEVTNENDVAMTNISLVDDKLGAITCPLTSLGPHESMTCSANGTAVLGQYDNLGVVTGDTDWGPVVCDDPSHYFGTPEPVCTIQKSTNGHDADVAPGPEIEEGQPVLWTYEVTNENDIEMTNISLVDDKLGAITCPKTTLAPNESMTCSANGTAVLGQYENLGTVTGETRWGDVTCDDPSHYFGTPIITPEPVCTIEKATNGHDADVQPGPEIEEGQPVTWTYEVTNENDIPMTNISLVDDKLGAITCPLTTLGPHESMTCTANGTAVLGQYDNLGVVTGDTDWGPVVCDDPSHYYGTREPGIAGCTPGYWKQRHHFFAWTDPYSPATKFADVFLSCGDVYGDISLLGALKQGGGGFNALGRHAVAALLNAASGEVGYEWSVPEVIDAVNAACINGDPDFVESLKDDLDEWNNRGCPLGRER